MPIPFFGKVICWDAAPLLNPPVEKQSGHLQGDSSTPPCCKRYEPALNQWLVPQYSIPSIFAIVAWLYSSIVVLFLSGSVPELYNLFMTKCMWFTSMSGSHVSGVVEPPSRGAWQDWRLLNGRALESWYVMCRGRQTSSLHCVTTEPSGTLLLLRVWCLSPLFSKIRSFSF